MFQFISAVTIVLCAFSTATALVIPRAVVPAAYREDILEPYSQYNTRYMAIGCDSQHGTAFFDACCHPLKQGETLEKNRAPECNPANVSSAQPSATPEPDCDDDEPLSSIVSSVIPTSAPAPSSQAASAPSSKAAASAPSPSAALTSPPVLTAAPPSSSHVASSSVAPAPPKETSSEAPKPSSTKAAPAPAATKAAQSSGVNSGGFATFFFQNGVAGACGKVHDDNAMIAAIDQDRYGNAGNASPLCGKQVEITNTKNGKTVTVTIADDCPTCTNSNSIDLSKGAFNAIATEEEGMVPITWEFI